MSTLQSFEKIKNCYTVELKSGEKEYFVEGYISTYDIDSYNDVVTKKGMLDIYESADTIKIDLEHEAFKPDEEGYDQFGSRSSIIPVGKIVEKRLDDVGVWVKAKINPHITRFKTIWGSIKDGFVDAFSIAFTEPAGGDYGVRESDGARLLDKINLLNVALTGNPVNKNARFTNVVGKSRSNLFKMEEEKPTVEEKSDDVKEVKEVETKSEESSTQETPQVDSTVELKAVVNALQEIKELLAVKAVEEPKKEVVDIKSVLDEIKSIKEELHKPVLKAKVEEKAEEKIGGFNY